MKKRDKILMILFAVLQISFIVLGIFEKLDWLIATSPICILLIVLIILMLIPPNKQSI